MNKCLISFISLLMWAIFPMLISASHFSMDRYFSPHSSSSNFIALQDVAFNLQNKFEYSKGSLPNDFEGMDLLDYSFLYQYSALSDWRADGLPKMGLRVAELGLIWQPLNLMAYVVQHEIFGHGYRVRSFGVDVAHVTRYVLSFKFDWNGLGIKDALTRVSYKRLASPSEFLSVDIGGIEANLVFSHNMLMSWLKKGEIDGRQASLWRNAHFDGANYIRTLKRFNGYQTYMLSKEVGHDIANYLTLLNQIYPASKSMDEQLQDLQTKSLLSLFFNPMTYISYYSELAYILFHSSVPIPGIKIREMFALPSYHLALTPFGPEDVFEVYIWNKGKAPTYVYFKALEHMNDLYFGLGFENRGLFNLKWGSIGLKVNLWVQPQMLLEPMSNEEGYYILFEGRNQYDNFWITPDEKGLLASKYFSKTFGGSSSIVYSHLINKLSNVNLELGYKTQGYLPGESLVRSLIARCGLQVQF